MAAPGTWSGPFSTRAAFIVFVQTRQALERKSSPASARATPQRAAASASSKAARDEIYTYISIRDLLLSDAEMTTTEESLRRATAANDFVETCLRPARSPYEAQSLCEVDAERERERCRAARARIARLHRRVA